MNRSPFASNSGAGAAPLTVGKEFPRRLRERRSHRVVRWSPPPTASRRPFGENEIGVTTPVATWIGDPSCEPEGRGNL
jgi:hypothetical protein